MAVLLTNARLTRRGAEKWVVIDICLLAVPLAIIVARIYHVVTHLGFYFGPGRTPGTSPAGLRLGDLGGRHRHLRRADRRRRRRDPRLQVDRHPVLDFADAVAPGLIIAQAMGRFGNWFNQELFGQPTDLPWGLEIAAGNPAIPVGLPSGTLFQPTFLYEVIWNLLGAAVILWAGNRFGLQWGQAVRDLPHLVLRGPNRLGIIRIDPSDIILGLRTNVWAAIFGVVLGIVIFVVQSRRHLGLEPSPYVPGREGKAPGL